MDIDEKTIKETTQCRHNMDCLKNEEHHCIKTKVKDCIEGKLHFMHCTDYSCTYRMHYGNSEICHCPIRKEIYNKYKI